MDKNTEGELLLSCLHQGADSASTSRFAQLSDQDWDDVIQQSIRHGVTPLLYQYLKIISPSVQIPIPVLQKLRAMALDHALRNLLLYRELSQVLRELQNDSISVIVLKGAYLAEVIYGNTTLRPMHDVDLLVRKTDLSKAEARMRALGYGPLEDPRIEVDYTIHQHLRPLIKPGAVPIEIHWTIEHPNSPFDIEVDELWNRARSATIAGVQVLVFDPEDLLLHICLHASFHHKFLFGLRPFCDILEIIRHFQGEIDWQQVQHRARRWGIQKYVYLTLYLARELVRADVPEVVLDSLKPQGFDPRVMVWARTQIFSDETAITSLSSNLAQLWGVRLFQDKLALFLKSVFPAPAIMARMYPSSCNSKWFYLYYPLRWKDLLFQYGRSAWRLVRREDEMLTLVERENQKAALGRWLKATQ